MKVEYINPFVTSTQLVFSTMLNCRLTREKPLAKTSPHPSYAVSGVVGLCGKAHGTVVLSLTEEVALAATAEMLKKRPEEVDADVVDAIGELTNVIAGRAKAELEQFELGISLPNVVTGTEYQIEFPSEATPITIPFQSPWGPLAVEVGFVEQPAEELATT